ncbi:MAG: hypothetical protein WKF92_16565 [Pyrinomonadaceae bacterium]
MSFTERLLKSAMKWTFEKVESPDYIRIVTNGCYSADDYLQVFTDLFALPCWSLGTAVLIDNRNIDLSTASTTGLLRLARGFLRFNNELVFTRISVLYSTEQALEIAKGYGRITDSRTTARVRRFLDEKLALDWLWPENAVAAETLKTNSFPPLIRSKAPADAIVGVIGGLC